MTTGATATILYDLSALAVLGRQDRYGNPEKPLLLKASLPHLEEMERGNRPVRLAVMQRHVRLPAGRRILRELGLAKHFPTDVFAAAVDRTGRFDSRCFLKRVGVELGFPGDGAGIGVLVTPDVTFRRTAAEEGWRAASSIEEVPGLLAHPHVSLFRMRGSAATALFSMRRVQVRPWLRLLASTASDPPEHLVLAFDRGAVLASMRSGNASLDAEMDPIVDDVGARRIVEAHLDGLTEEEGAGYLEDLRCRGHDVSRMDAGRVLVVAGLGDDWKAPPHPPRVSHGHFLSVQERALTTDWPPDPPPLEAQELSDEERCAINGRKLFGQYRRLHDRLCGRVPTPHGDCLDNRHSLSRYNLAAVRFIGRFLSRTLHESFVYRALDFDADVPVYTVEGRIPGTDPGAGTVLLGAHLDSTATYDGTYHPKGAPGADDDASGVAAVMCAARILSKLAMSSPPRREIRFVLFNSEEQGMVGSLRYARELQAELAAGGGCVAAMIQADMIGWRSAHYDGLSPAVIHAPGRSVGDDSAPENQDPDNSLVEAIRSAADELGLQGWIDEEPPPAGGTFLRSDHGSFLSSGYRACAVTERGMYELTSGRHEPPRSNPAYHRLSDTGIDLRTAVTVTRILAATIWKIAKQPWRNPR